MYRYMLQEVRDFENSAGDAGSIRGALYAQLRGSVYGCEQACYRELGEDETIEERSRGRKLYGEKEDCGPSSDAMHGSAFEGRGAA